MDHELPPSKFYPSKTGYLEMMGKAILESKVNYTFRVTLYQDEWEGKKPEKSPKWKQVEWELNPLVGKEFYLTFSGKIRCVDCGRPTKKSFNQGSCYVCFTKLASNDSCILRPKECHFFKGTCREPEWGRENCFKKHTIYLAITSGGKVGITKEDPVYNRWIDQGAIEAIPIADTNSRLEAGIIEEFLSKYIPDKTSWQKMLTTKETDFNIDLVKEREKFLEELKKNKFFYYNEHQKKLSVELKERKDKPTSIQYPIQAQPKLKSIQVEPGKKIGGKLVGIKGQYLLFDSGVINLRSYQGYEVTWEFF